MNDMLNDTFFNENSFRRQFNADPSIDLRPFFRSEILRLLEVQKIVPGKGRAHLSQERSP